MNPRETIQRLSGSPPHDVQAEAALIASILIDPTVIERIDGKVKPIDFYDDAHREVFKMLVAMHEADEQVADVKLVLANIKAAGKAGLIGGAAYFGQVLREVGSPASAVHFAEILAENGRRRRLIAMCAEAMGRCFDQLDESSRVSEWIEAKLASLGVTDSSDIISLGKATQTLVERIAAARKVAQKVGVPTGLPSLDKDIGGLFRSDLVVVAARPSIGKTSLGVQLARHAASLGLPSLFVSLEMQDWELAGRIAASEVDVNFRLIRNGEVNDRQLGELQALACGQRDFPFHLWRPRAATIEKIRAKAKMMKATIGLSFLVIDYLTKVSPTDPRVPRHEQIEHVVGASKNLAKELDVPVLMLAQAKRTDHNRRPRLDDLFGSSMIEADADVVLMIHREDRNATEAIIGIEKNRNGVTGDVRLGYRCHRTEFFDPDYENGADERSDSQTEMAF